MCTFGVWTTIGGLIGTFTDGGVIVTGGRLSVTAGGSTENPGIETVTEGGFTTRGGGP
jgi:hypothetical protein